MKALSIRQPWAWLIVAGYKDVENRKWSTSLRGRIYVHASSTLDRDGLIFITSGSMNISSEVREAVRQKKDWELGALIGEVDIIDCVTQSDSPWFSGPYGFVLENPLIYESPMLCRGKLNFFTPEISPI